MPPQDPFHNPLFFFLARKPYSLLRNHKLLRIHIQPTQPRHAPAQLQQRLHALQDLHMRKPNLLDKLELSMLAQRRDRLGDLEHGRNDIMTGIPKIPQLPQAVQRRINITLVARLEHRLHLDRVRAIHHLEYIISAHEPEARVRRLQVIDRLPHVTFGAEDQSRKAVVAVLDFFGFDDLQQPLDDLRVGELGVAQNCAAGLERLDDLVGLVAGEGEARGVRVDLHCAAKRLLRARGHAVGFVEDYDFVSPGREGDFLLGEAFDSLADYFDACFFWVGLRVSMGVGW